MQTLLCTGLMPLHLHSYALMEREHAFGPVVHKMANPVIRTIWSMSHINEINLHEARGQVYAIL